MHFQGTEEHRITSHCSRLWQINKVNGIARAVCCIISNASLSNPPKSSPHVLMRVPLSSCILNTVQCDDLDYWAWYKIVWAAKLMSINIFPLLNWPGKPVEKEELNDKLLPYPLFCHYESVHTSLDCLFVRTRLPFASLVSKFNCWTIMRQQVVFIIECTDWTCLGWDGQVPWATTRGGNISSAQYFILNPPFSGCLFLFGGANGECRHKIGFRLLDILRPLTGISTNLLHIKSSANLAFTGHMTQTLWSEQKGNEGCTHGHRVLPVLNTSTVISDFKYMCRQWAGGKVGDQQECWS